MTACYADWAREKATVRMDSLLREVEHIDCVFGHNDEMAQGAREAMVRAGRDSSVLYVGIDGLPSKGGGLEAVYANRLSASCIYPTRGDLLLELARNILEKKPYKKENELPRCARHFRECDAFLHAGHRTQATIPAIGVV